MGQFFLFLEWRWFFPIPSPNCPLTTGLAIVKVDTFCRCGTQNIEFKNLFRLKSQKGTFELAKASSGGQSIRRLIAIDLPKKGYTIPILKEIVRSSLLYIIPLNSNIDLEPVTFNYLQTIAGDDIKEEWECETSMKLVPANQFREHKGVCLEEIFQVSFTSKTITHKVQG